MTARAIKATSTNAATMTDQLGRPITLGARVVPIDALGTVLWSRSGRVTGRGRTLVHVQWSRARYDQDRRYHAVRAEDCGSGSRDGQRVHR